MRIVFFGTSHGVPEPNRRCSSAMIEVGENRYFIDMGTQVMEQLVTRKISPDSVKAIFITHMHGDHTDGLINFIDLANWYYKNTSPAVFLPGPVDAIASAIGTWLELNHIPMRGFNFKPVEEGLLYDDGTLRITAYRTLHIDRSYAYLAEAEGKRVFFSGDMCHKGPQEDFPLCIFEKPVDLAICESAHFPATDYLPMLKDQPNLKQLCINHYSDVYLASVLETEKLMQPIPTCHAFDGMEFVL